MPYKKMTEVPPSLKGIDPPITLAQANEIAAMADAIGGDNAWPMAIAQWKKGYQVEGTGDAKKWVKKQSTEGDEAKEASTLKSMLQGLMRDVEELLALRSVPEGIRKEVEDVRAALKKRWETLGVDGEEAEESWDEPEQAYVTPIGILTLADLDAFRQAEAQERTMRQWFDDFVTVAREIMYSPDVKDKGAAIQALARELALRLGTSEPGVMEHAVPEEGAGTAAPEQEAHQLRESVGGASIVALGESVGQASGPLVMTIKLLEPGPGNREDRHYYKADMLRKYAGVFAGAKMYETDHKEGEYSNRTWVSTVRRISGWTETGAPLAEVVVHAPDFAERVRNLAQAGLLDKLESSIRAIGQAHEAVIEGKNYKVVDRIDDALSVDWVTRAGAGGRAISVDEMGETQQETVEEYVMAEKAGTQTEEQNEETSVAATEVLSREAVRVVLAEKTRLNPALAELLALREFETEPAVLDAAKALAEALDMSTGAGQVKDNKGGQSKAPQTLSEAQINANLEAVNRRWLGVGGPEKTGKE